MQAIATGTLKSMTSLLTELLDIKGVEVSGYRNDTDSIVFEVSPCERQSTCPNCGQASQRVHQNHAHLAQDLPVSGKDVLIKYIASSRLVRYA